MRQIPELTELERDCQNSRRFRGSSEKGSKARGGVEDETCEERPMGAGLLHLKKICTRET